MTPAPLRSPITLITDGACSGNGTADSRGGWAAILIDSLSQEVVLTGAEAPSTNNRMELMAALEGLSAAPPDADIELVTDSTYLANAISQGWLDGWQRRGWKTASKQPVANRELWERMIVELRRHHRVRTTLVRGHSGHDANERADRLAQQAAADGTGETTGPAPERRDPPVPGPGQLGFTFET
jgi:ribonuclease HI